MKKITISLIFVCISLFILSGCNFITISNSKNNTTIKNTSINTIKENSTNITISTTKTTYKYDDTKNAYLIDGIYYQIDNNKAIVVGKEGNNTTLNILEEVSINNKVYSVTTIALEAFMSRSDIKEVIIPKSITTVYENAFKDCTNLTTLTIYGNSTIFSSSEFEDCTKLKNVYIYGSIKNLSSYMFYNCDSLENIYLPKDIKEIEYRALPYKEGLNLYYDGTNDNFNNIDIDYSIELNNLNIKYSSSPEHNHSTIKGYLYDSNYHYSKCDSCSTLYNKESHNYNSSNICTKCGFKKSENELEYTLSEDGNYYIVSGIGNIKDTTINIKDSYNNLPIKEIGYRAFYNNTNFNKIVLPNTITVIRKEAFKETKIESINLVDSIESIETEAFAKCHNLREVIIPKGMTTIVTGTFDECYSIVRVVIPSNITKIEKNAFSLCHRLTEVVNESKSFTLKAGATGNGDITKRALYVTTDRNDTKLTYTNDFIIYNNDTTIMYIGSNDTVTVPNTITKIGNNTFYDSDLKKIVISSSVKTIGDYAFKNCELLEEIYIPSNVESIGMDAFFNNYSLKDVYTEHSKNSFNSILDDRSFESISNINFHYNEEFN